MNNISNSFKWDEYFWVSNQQLPFWSGFQDRSGPYGSKGSNDKSDGTVTITFAPEGRGREPEPLTDKELKLVDWFVQHESEVSSAALKSIFSNYPALRKNHDGSWIQKILLMPKIKSEDSLRELIGLHSITIHQISNNGIPYIGFMFGCNWDSEHGLGILMHGTRTVKIGGEDTAILLWIARQDAEQP